MPLKILLVDDDLEDLELLEEAILEHDPGSEIDKATGGKAAIDFLDSYQDSHLPNLIVLDYNMPNVSGLDVLAYIKKYNRFNNVARVMYSTSDAERYISDSLKNGAVQYFVKPSMQIELDGIVSKMLLIAARNS